MDIEAVKGTDPDTGEEITRKPDAKEPFAALAFKIMTDPFVGRLAFFRAYSGHLGCRFLCAECKKRKERTYQPYHENACQQTKPD